MAFTPKQEKLIDAALALSELSDIYVALAKFTMAHNPETDPVAFELLTEIADIGEKYIKLEAQKPSTDGEFSTYTSPEGRKFYVNPTDVVGSYERTFGNKLTPHEAAALVEAMKAGEEAMKAGMSISDAAAIAGTAAVMSEPGIAKKAE